MSNQVSDRGGCALAARGLSFSYPAVLAGGETAPVLHDLSLEVPQGAFALLTGATGSGKTTLLRLAKPEVAPAGTCEGTLEVLGRDVAALAPRTSMPEVGFIFQSPDNQLVCDSVWHELAFGLENLGTPQRTMRLRLAETCQFLGIEGLYRSRCAELSGGQRQLVALASVLVMRPRLLLLDEPTAQLDPVAEKDFLALLFRINRELGVTVVVATHRPAPMVDYASCAFVLEDGQVREVVLEGLRHVGELPPRVGEPSAKEPSSAKVRTDGVAWRADKTDRALRLDDVWYRYERDSAWVLRGCDLSVRCGEVYALMGANGCGKSTLLMLAAGVARPRRGHVARPLAAAQALLPQQPQALLGCETVAGELAEWSRAGGYGEAEVEAALERLGLSAARDRHPFDLSAGQQELLALEKLLLAQPQLLLLDEPTKGLDDTARAYLAARVRELADAGVTCVVATHDASFVRATCDTVSLVFDGQCVLTEGALDFLSESWVYGGVR